MYSQFYNFAALVGPVIGGVFYLYFGFERTMDINMIAEFILAGCFYYYNCGRKVKSQEKHLQETIKKLKEIGELRKKTIEMGEEGGDTTNFTS